MRNLTLHTPHQAGYSFSKIYNSVIPTTALFVGMTRFEGDCAELAACSRLLCSTIPNKEPTVYPDGYTVGFDSIFEGSLYFCYLELLVNFMVSSIFSVEK